MEYIIINFNSNLASNFKCIFRIKSFTVKSGNENIECFKILKIIDSSLAPKERISFNWNESSNA